jgi:hypothetical protein
MKDYRERALALLQGAKKANIPEYEVKALAVAQMWLSLSTIDQQLAIWANQIQPSEPAKTTGGIRS